MSKLTKIWVAATVCVLTGAAGMGSARAATSAGYGALGDSFADEYQFYPPDRSTVRHFADLLSAERGGDYRRRPERPARDPAATVSGVGCGGTASCRSL